MVVWGGMFSCFKRLGSTFLHHRNPSTQELLHVCKDECNEIQQGCPLMVYFIAQGKLNIHSTTLDTITIHKMWIGQSSVEPANQKHAWAILNCCILNYFMTSWQSEGKHERFSLEVSPNYILNYWKYAFI